MTIDLAHHLYLYVLARLRLDPRRDEGITAEWVVITFIAVGIAIVAGKMILDSTKGNAETIPTPTVPQGG